ncbi:MAG TPA: amidohydrolase family protein [Chryseolinea sp.]|nr:amidohydrolase family protein [Chryseolinea sp.]
MKKVLLLFIFGSIIECSLAQVQVRPLPTSGFEKRIRDYVDDMRVVDTHEHLMHKDYLKKRTTLDFMLLLQGYSDLRGAGMANTGILTKDSLSPVEKWKILKPYWEASSNTAYNRIALLTADKLFGVKDINESTVTELSNKIAKAYESKDWINQVIDKCKIDYVIEDNLITEPSAERFDNEKYRYVKRFDNFVNINSRQRISFIGKERNISIQSLDALVAALAADFKKAKETGIVAIKIGLAYARVLSFDDVKKDRAEEVFNTIMNMDERMLTFADVKPLQDYMLHRVLDQAKLHNVVVQIHTGFQQYGNLVSNANPLNLFNLFREYPTVKFVLFHGSYPFGGELSAIAKAFPNVHLDLTWVYVLSPSFSERFLHEWLETIPASKITGFGGDYGNVENVLGHLLFAKQIIANVLVAKVKDGYFSETEAKNIARMLLYDNAMNIYKLSKSDQLMPEQIYYKMP